LTFTLADFAGSQLPALFGQRLRIFGKRMFAEANASSRPTVEPEFCGMRQGFAAGISHERWGARKADRETARRLVFDPRFHPESEVPMSTYVDPDSIPGMARRIAWTAEYAMQKLYEPRILAQLARFQAAADHAALMRGMAHLRASSMVLGMSGLGLTLVVPLAVWAGVWAALGAGLYEAKALVKKKEFESGFSHGFVMRLLGWDWSHVVSRFFRFSPGSINPFDESIAYAGANAYNEGLRASFVYASIYDKKTQAALLAKLKAASPSSRAGRWNRRDQIDYVIELAAAGWRTNVFVSAE
jgi:hypothetical protein